MRLFRARSDVMARSDRGDRRALKIPGLSKLRIGGSIGKAAEKVKGTLNNTKVLGIPLGAGIGAATGGLGGLAAAESSRAGGDLGQALKNTGGDLVQGAKNLPLALAGAGGGAGGAGGLSGAVGGLAGALSGNAGKVLDLGLGTAGMINAAQLGKKSSDYATGAYDQSQANWKSREPLRLAGVQGMLNPQTTTDVSTIGAKARASNPFATPFQKPKPLALPLHGGAPQNLPPMVMGKPTTDQQAQQAMDRVQHVVNGGVGNVRTVLRAAQGGS